MHTKKHLHNIIFKFKMNICIDAFYILKLFCCFIFTYIPIDFIKYDINNPPYYISTYI